MKKIKVGLKVKCIGKDSDNGGWEGNYGVIVCVYESSFGVSFSKKSNNGHGHSCSGLAKKGMGWNFSNEEYGKIIIPACLEQYEFDF